MSIKRSEVEKAVILGSILYVKYQKGQKVIRDRVRFLQVRSQEALVECDGIQDWWALRCITPINSRS